MSADRQPQKSSRSWIFLAARWAAALVILGILFYLLPVGPLRNALSRVPLTRFIAVLLIYLLVLTGGITKWHTVVNSAGAQLRFAPSAECYTSGLFGALFLPSIIGGDVARLAVGISHSPRPAAVITGNVADRFLDVAAQLTLVSLGLMLLPASSPRRFFSFSSWHCTGRSCAGAPFESGEYSRNFVTRSGRFRAVLTGCFLAGCWELPCRARMFFSPRSWVLLVASLCRCVYGSSRGPWLNSPRSCPSRKGELGFAKRRWWCCSRRLARRHRRFWQRESFGKA